MILFCSNENKLFKKAELLIPAIDALYLTTYPGLKEAFPVLKQITDTKWNICFKIASLTTAMVSLIASDHKQKSRSKVGKKLKEVLDNEFDAEWCILFTDCNEFFHANMERLEKENNKIPLFAIADTMGLWMVRIMFSQAEAETERKELIRPFGILATKEFLEWWKD
ncbi:MAG: hypothetical protein ABIP35_15015 [Ginsengibacter sp.]